MLGPNRFITGGGHPVPKSVTLISCAWADTGTIASKLAKSVMQERQKTDLLEVAMTDSTNR
jgi:hypothetical protein